MLLILQLALGTFLGNFSLVLLVGFLAKRAEKQQLEKLKELQNQLQDSINKEQQRMRKYAEMEG